MVKVNAVAKQTFDDVLEALLLGNRRKADRILRTASRRGASLVDVFEIALLSKKPGRSPAPSDAQSLSNEIGSSSLTAEKAVEYTVKALQNGERSKAAAIMRHAVHSGISPADLAEVGLKNTNLVAGAQESEVATPHTVIDVTGGGVTQSKISSSTSEEETS